MRKLKLKLDDLKVTAFETADMPQGRAGTVKAHVTAPAQTNQLFPCGEPFTEQFSCAYTACGDPGCSNMNTWCANCTDWGWA
ncbi:hypothetical protein [Longimicrobium sp.]|uniref:hypothetical protein n=1 Tax=Longimicrobium sp. TaxID=2029185 RepID=UPI002E34F1AE|nr:hypothetical protein [Longimicrobium sp.]HEX6042708.1 hypothetical protein [Longimicrobium sp.]